MSSSNPGVLGRSLRAIGRTIDRTRIVVINAIFLLVLALVLLAIFSGGPGPIPERAPLRVEITGFLVDQRSYIDPVAQMLTPSAGSSETVVRDVVRAIKAGAQDPRITELVLELQYFTGGDISKLEEIGTALSTFKDSGKPITAVSAFYSQAQYYLASYADQVLMDPMGAVLLTGYGSYRNYFNEALDKLNINLHVFRVGEYKDAVEPFTRMSMSEASREHNSQWIDQLWGIYTSRVETQRQLPKDAINDYVSNLDQHLLSLDGDAAALAVQNKLVDSLTTAPQLRQMLIEKYGYDEQQDSYRAVPYLRYVDHLEQQPAMARNRIGLIVASGTIFDGEQPPGSIGGDTLAALIREARESRDVQALVLRIDSGGGSAFASEIIRSELLATQDAGIPVIVSMGSVAASGGYWIAANADEIWATPTTLTGSIGVFSILPTFENSLDRLGISTDGYGTNTLADSMRLDMPLDPIAANVIQLNVENIYRRFLTIVAEGRNTEPDLVHPIAQGRVWSGIAAQELGLVDKLGYLDDAIAAAAEHGGVSDYQVEVIEQVLSPWELFVQSMGTGARSLLRSAVEAETGLDPAALGQTRSPWKGLAELMQLVQTDKRPGSVYAHCTQCVSPR
ncbi:signal peptide peptidase SppA [Gilvimarinus sp. F26214L]|uniref:signal peptide peptidase SppA n=1 Tax=Gilvimarinus sp. DZF01 TaxID=3461371 RepID=UPI004045EA0C